MGRQVAALYARARPFIHDHIVDLILTRQSRVASALDVACGTGLSTAPLLSVANRVVGVDASEDMLAAASRVAGVAFVRATADRLPFDDQVFDLTTVCSALHWLKRGALVELCRILRDDGSLVVYDVWFPAEMVGEPRFADWMSDVCVPRYPPVAKNRDNLTALPNAGFRRSWSADRRYEVAMTLGSLVELLMTHSERIAAVKDGRETEAEQREFLAGGLQYLFVGRPERTLVFGIRAWAFQRRGLLRS
jgi:ubiquinone/menaquinone biosynthesis C-methylase UbiE